MKDIIVRAFYKIGVQNCYNIYAKVSLCLLEIIITHSTNCVACCLLSKKQVQ